MNSLLLYAGVVESADTTDLKSVGGDIVRVQVPSPAPLFIGFASFDSRERPATWQVDRVWFIVFASKAYAVDETVVGSNPTLAAI